MRRVALSWNRFWLRLMSKCILKVLNTSTMLFAFSGNIDGRPKYDHVRHWFLVAKRRGINVISLFNTIVSRRNQQTVKMQINILAAWQFAIPGSHLFAPASYPFLTYASAAFNFTLASDLFSFKIEITSPQLMPIIMHCK